MHVANCRVYIIMCEYMYEMAALSLFLRSSAEKQDKSILGKRFMFACVHLAIYIAIRRMCFAASCHTNTTATKNGTTRRRLAACIPTKKYYFLSARHRHNRKYMHKSSVSHFIMCVVAYFLAFSEQAKEYKNILEKLYVIHMCGWRACIILFADGIFIFIGLSSQEVKVNKL